MRVTLCFDAGVGTADDVTWTATTQLSFLFFFCRYGNLLAKEKYAKAQEKDEPSTSC